MDFEISYPNNRPNHRQATYRKGIRVSHSHQFCVRPADGNPVVAVWTSDYAVHIDLVRWVVATRMEYALRAGHCTIGDFHASDCGGTPIYHSRYGR